MSADCSGYYSAEKVFVDAFTCPKPESDARAVFCCGFNDIKYCCDDPNSFFPYEYGYMWWLSVGALVGLSVAAVILLAFIVTLCVLCYLFIATKPSQLDNGLQLQATGPGVSALEQHGHLSTPTAPQGFCKHFLPCKLDCDNQPPDPDRLFQKCFMATVTVNVEGPSQT
ncbi:protein shisa-like-2A [Paramormyrops kingsleyae]|uniref:Shisa like 2A n=1 Tax=Paramormyrops kingsleyae TaxID=1676925 RepID=A0A3B3SIN9_9TELE|nr:membrane protein FAM159A-like [Paramormyrops kingsleyae]